MPQSLCTPILGYKSIVHKEEHVNLSICESTSGYPYHARLVHEHADIVVFCVSIISLTSRYSYDNIDRCLAEIYYHLPSIPILLVGTKLDLVEDEESLDQLRAKHLAPIDRLVGYLECSAMTMDGVYEVFAESVRIATS
ncbi:P-loop containing nucleoside triphosphate hydrolase protein [Flagelloscypha sp. PMI_526]|nr:P-loop containing nucleoside triphosphate hydrolase protein [Flagelloscypha sp. PMI_526]